MKAINVILITIMLGAASCGNAQVEGNGPADKVYEEVDVMPEFPGGMGEMMTYLGENIKYPKDSHDAGIEGKVFVSFVVTNTGEIADVKILEGVAADLDEESIRVVSSMPNWTPGEKDGGKVSVQMTLPILFKLASDE